MPDTAPPPRMVRLADYRPPAFLVDSVDLRFELAPMETRVFSRLAVRRNAAPTAPLRLDGEDLTLVAVVLDGVKLAPERFSLEAGGLVIPDVPDAFTLQVETLLAPARNTELSGLYVSNGSFFTQCEAEGFRRITFFPDRPDVMACFTVTLVADAAAVPVLLSNGNPGAVELGADGRHRITWTDPHPKPCYLFALVAGDLVAVRDHFTTGSGREVALAIWVRSGDEDRCGHAMEALKQSMRWEEAVFGLEYDLDVFNIAAVSDFNMGAMENKGLNVFNTKYVLARPETATDADYQGIETVIAHEYFHNWTGNRVTCRDWFQLSLKEGLTVFRDQEFSADQGSRAVRRIADVRALRAAQFREDAGPLAHPVQPDAYMAIDNFYTATIYQKGAEVIRMMATIIGRDSFRRGMDLYFARHDNHAVTIDDFVAAMQDASGVDLERFKRWYHQAGTPELSVEDAYDAAARRYTLTLRQQTAPTAGQADKQPLVIPLSMALLDSAGSAMPMRLENENAAGADQRVLMVTEAEQGFTFVDVAERPVPSLLREFSAPVRLSGVPMAQLRFLAAHDGDPFVRWDSGQQHATRLLLDMAAGGDTAVPDALIETAAAVLRAADADPAFAAEALALPGEAFLADQMAVVDPNALHAARDRARAAIGTALRSELRAAYDRLDESGAYRIDGAAMGRRALRNSCLSLLAAGNAGEGAQLAAAQFDAGRNMTDVLAALVVLASIEGPERARALASFHDRWQDDALVLDKWFAIQAMSPLPSTVAAVRALAEHPRFDLAAPNRMRALVGSFASGNAVRFHDSTGAGYAFVADIIVRLDPLNGQTAARMSSVFAPWRRYDPARQALMGAQLRRILALPGLSKGTFEMVSRALG